MIATRQRLDRRLGALAFLAGLALAAFLVLGWRLAPGPGELGLELRLVVNSTGELGVSPAGQLAVGRGLRPRTDRDGLDAQTTVRNQTADPLRVTVRGRPSSRDLDRALVVTVRMAGRPLFDGPLAGLRAFSRRGASLAPGERAQLSVSVRLPAHAQSGYQARVEDLTLELGTKAR
ncbi:MAG TPA: hypothetical protein VGO83_09290 [Thermoleophilaceae bacterium]|jgi:hypothetical protein|nr:hypothetical protein [Thermoleophilaceae bacterium]